MNQSTVHTAVQGYVFTRMGVNLYDDYYEACPKNLGMWLKGSPREHDRNLEDCDIEWAKKGYITVSPARFDPNDYKTLEKLKGLQL